MPENSQHPSPDVKNPLQFRTEILARNDHITRCQKCLFSRLQDVRFVTTSGVFLGFSLPKNIASRDGCVLMMPDRAQIENEFFFFCGWLSR